MAKVNPLFTDSTLLQGDPIGTQIELNDILTYDDENLYFVIVKPDGQETYLPMEKVEETGFFEVFVRLVHQKPVSFYFGIEKEGELLLKTELQQRIARYALIESWEPLRSLYPNGRSQKASPSAQEMNDVEALLGKAEEIGEMLETTSDEASPESLAETSAESAGEPASIEIKTPAKGSPILKPDQVQDITDLLQKWGFS